ncbi:MAG: chloride channel protein [Desulfovibrionaceae bacterium]
MATPKKLLLPAALAEKIQPRNLALWGAAVFCGLLAGLAAEALNYALAASAGALRPYRGYWWAMGLPALGAAVAVLLKHYVFHQTEREGIPRVISSICCKDGELDPKSSVTDLLYCVLSLGSGGSVGPEGPVAGSGAAIGANLIQVFRLPANFRITLAASGVAGAISAIFNAPSTGVIFAMEVILGSWTPFHLVPIAISALSAAWLSRHISGRSAAFQAAQSSLHNMDWLSVIAVILFSVAVSVALTRLIRHVGRYSERLVGNAWIRAAAGGLLVGMIGMAMPMVLGEGYRPTIEAINNNFPSGLGLAALFVAAKIVATSLSLGTGAPGGVFAPSLVLGSASGLVCFRFLNFITAGRYLPADETGFALMGMAGVMSGVMQAPLTGLVLVLEITASHGAIFPLMVTVLAAAVISHRLEPIPFYYKPLVDAGEYAPPKSDRRILAHIRLTEAIDNSRLIVAPEDTVAEFLGRLKTSLNTNIPVVDADGRYVGLIGVNRMRRKLLDPGWSGHTVGELVKGQDIPLVDPAAQVSGVLETMDESKQTILPVVRDGKYLGVVSREDLLTLYRRRKVEDESLEQSF